MSAALLVVVHTSTWDLARSQESTVLSALGANINPSCSIPRLASRRHGLNYGMWWALHSDQTRLDLTRPGRSEQARPDPTRPGKTRTDPRRPEQTKPEQDPGHVARHIRACIITHRRLAKQRRTRVQQHTRGATPGTRHSGDYLAASSCVPQWPRWLADVTALQ